MNQDAYLTNNIEDLDLVGLLVSTLEHEKLLDLAAKQIARELGDSVRRAYDENTAKHLLMHKAQSYMKPEQATSFAREVYERYDIDARIPRRGYAPKRAVGDFLRGVEGKRKPNEY